MTPADEFLKDLKAVMEKHDVKFRYYGRGEGGYEFVNDSTDLYIDVDDLEDLLSNIELEPPKG